MQFSVSKAMAWVVRVVTIPPLMAAALLSILYVARPSLFGTIWHYLFSLIFLAILPVLAYPIQALIPALRRFKREGQRNLAMAMSVLGYVGGLLYAILAQVSDGLLLIYLTYFFSGFGLLFFNKVIHVRASGHACAIVGPVTALIYFLGPAALPGILVPGIVYWSSLKTKRHTLFELFWGSVVPVASLFLSLLLIGLV